MTAGRPWYARLAPLVARLRPDPAVPARAWLRAKWRPLAALAGAVTLVATFDVWLGTCGFEGCPSAADIQAFRPSEGSRVLDRGGAMMGRLTYVRRINVPLARIPASVRQAFIATEDRRFFRHNGLDWRGAFRAAARNVAALGVREGFSTITMQVARNTYAPHLARSRSLRRKLIELRLARLLEHNLNKQQILELYLNIIYLGNGTYGVEAASRDLFGKSVNQLSLAEAATLAALPKGPSVYTPRHDEQRATRRRNLVLRLMAQEGYITADRARRAAEQPMRIADEEWRPQPDRSYAVDAVRALVDSVMGPDATDEGDVVVFTTLDAVAQRAAERAISAQAASIQRESTASYGRRGDEVEGAMVGIDPRNGEIRAMVGGRHYERKGFNRAVSAHRQPGSAFKPFVYAAALAANYTPATMLDDSPVDINGWAPANFGDEYGGRLTMRRALMRSANAATVRLSHAVGEAQVVATARRSGITSPLSPVPSIALGALEVTPLELVTAYAPFANGGMRVRPTLVRRIEALDGTVLWQAPAHDAPPVRVLDARDAFQLTSMLQSVVDRGTGRVVRDMGIAGLVAGKTGTTNNGADVWFVGYTPTLVAGFWFGYDTPRPIAEGAAGGRYAAPAWAQFYRAGWRERTPANAWQPPSGILMKVIDPETGDLAGEFCPTTQREWFKFGTEPKRVCTAHLEPDIDWPGVIAGQLGAAVRKLFRF